MEYSNSMLEQNREDEIFGRLLACFFNSVLIVDFVRMISQNNDTIVSLTQYLLYGGIAVYIYWSMCVKDKLKVNKGLFFFLILVLINMVISWIACPQVLQAYTTFTLFLILRSIPAIYFMLKLNDDRLKILFDIIAKYRFVWLAYALIGNIWILNHTNSWNQYSMTYGYNLLIPSGFLFYYFLKERKFKYLA